MFITKMRSSHICTSFSGMLSSKIDLTKFLVGFRRAVKLSLSIFLDLLRRELFAKIGLPYFLIMFKRVFLPKMTLSYFLSRFRSLRVTMAKSMFIAKIFTNPMFVAKHRLSFSLTRFRSMFIAKISLTYFRPGFRRHLHTQSRASFTSDIETFPIKWFQLVQPVLFSGRQSYW